MRGYLVSFYLLILMLRHGVPVGAADGILGALGTAATAVLGSVISGDPFTRPIVIGIAMIIAGVLLGGVLTIELTGSAGV